MEIDQTDPMSEPEEDDLTAGFRPKRAVAYIRVSTRSQAERDGRAEGFSIPAQREAIRRKAESLGALVVKEFVDPGQSGTTISRPGLQRMLTYLQETPGVDFLVVHKLDRLARSRVGDVEIGKVLAEAGVRLISTTENIDESPGGMLMHGIMSSIAEFYSQNLATEVVKGMRQKAQRGGTLGRAPLGYLNRHTTDEHGREVRDVILDPMRAPLVREAFRLYATGGWALGRLAAHLTSQGFTTRANAHYASHSLTASRLQTILTNPYYTGQVRYHGISYRGTHPPLVSPATWQLVQTVLASRRNGERIRTHPHFLVSSLYCRRCGGRMYVQHARSAHGRIYPYFICGNRARHEGGCTMPASLISQVEQAIEDQYHHVRLPDEISALSKSRATSPPQNLGRLYPKASATAKRLMNQALFERILIDRSSS